VSASTPQVTQGNRFILDGLTQPVDREDVAAARAISTPADRSDLALATRGAIAKSVVALILVGGVIGTVAGLPIYIATLMWPHWSAFVCVGIAASIVVILSWTLGRWRWRAVKSEWMWRPTWTHRARMHQMGLQNRLGYSPALAGYGPGSVLAAGGGNVWDLFVERDKVPAAWFGNARARGDAGQFRAPNGWSFVAVPLKTDVPHMFLIPQGDNLIGLGREQRLSLEGDFDRFFQLYAPVEYERDALYVITPDLMALLIDHLPGSYVETVDKLLIVTTPRSADFDSAEAWQRVSLLLDTVVPKALRQTRNYRDSRSAVAGEVASGGRRLRPGLSIAGLIVGIWTAVLILRVIIEATH
jgi:hypothetical protein